MRIPESNPEPFDRYHAVDNEATPIYYDDEASREPAIIDLSSPDYTGNKVEPVDPLEEPLSEMFRHPSSSDELSSTKRTSFASVAEAVLIAAHPLRPASGLEDVETLRRFYGAHLQLDPTRTAWYAIERTLAKPDEPPRFDEAYELLEQGLEQHAPLELRQTSDGLWSAKYATPRDAELWFQAAVAKANLPAFEDLADYGHIRAATAGEVYATLVTQALPAAFSRGDRGNQAELMVNSLAARAAMFGDSERFLYPSSPREGTSTLRNENGQTYNHDFKQYRQLSDGTRDVSFIETKAQTNTKPGPHHYDPSIIRVHFYDNVASSVMGRMVGMRSVRHHPERRPERVAHINAFYDHMLSLLAREVTQNTRLPELDAATNALYARIETQRREKGR